MQQDPQPWPDDLEYDPLVAFYNWYIQNGPTVPLSPIQAVSIAGAFTGLTLYRRGRHQVQLWIGPPYSTITTHRHHNHDNILMAISGIQKFTVSGEDYAYDPTATDIKGRWRFHGVIARVCRYDDHAVEFGPDGGAFVSFQYWPDSQITSAELDWDGEPLSADHGMVLGIQPKNDNLPKTPGPAGAKAGSSELLRGGQATWEVQP